MLVTGGAGYIGSHTCKRLAAEGFVPVTYDNLVHGHDWAVKWGPLEIGDIADGDRVREVLRTYKPVAAIHFAAFAYVGESVEDPARYYRNNVAGSLALLDALRAEKVDKIVFSSTCATYGVPASSPVTEAAPQQPINPYGTSKLMVERILADYGTAYGLRSVCLRYFNAAGADFDGEIGEDHAPETHLIPLAMRAAVQHNAPLQVYGDDYDTPDGSAVRDYVHVNDLGAVHVAALRYLIAGGASTAINIGTGKGASVLQIIEEVERVSQRRVAWRMAPRRPGDPPTLVADASRLKSVLGIDPDGFASLSDIVRSAWNWHSKHETADSD